MSIYKYKNFLWRKARKYVEDEVNQLYGPMYFNRDQEFYFWIHKQTDVRTKQYTASIVNDYMNEMASTQGLQIPRVLYQMVNKYAQVDPPRGT